MDLKSSYDAIGMLPEACLECGEKINWVKDHHSMKASCCGTDIELALTENPASSEYIKRCPCCGEIATLKTHHIGQNNAGISYIYFIDCFSCGLHSQFSAYKDDIIQKWNRRKNAPVDLQTMFRFQVEPKQRCSALKGMPDDHYFIGYVQWSDLYKQWYLTIDGISYTPLEHATNIEPIY